MELRRDRTDDLKLAKLGALPTELWPQNVPAGSHNKNWWAWVELNYRPHAYQACALTT